MPGLGNRSGRQGGRLGLGLNLARAHAGFVQQKLGLTGRELFAFGAEELEIEKADLLVFELKEAFQIFDSRFKPGLFLLLFVDLGLQSRDLGLQRREIVGGGAGIGLWRRQSHLFACLIHYIRRTCK